VRKKSHRKNCLGHTFLNERRERLLSQRFTHNDLLNWSRLNDLANNGRNNCALVLIPRSFLSFMQPYMRFLSLSLEGTKTKQLVVVVVVVVGVSNPFVPIYVNSESIRSS
jgi:hypothetical protein